MVDIAEGKRDKAFQLGATHFTTSMDEATGLVADLTHGVVADSALLTVGLVEEPMINDSLNIIRKGGAMVLTALASMADVTPTLPMTLFTLFQKRLLGITNPTSPTPPPHPAPNAIFNKGPPPNQTHHNQQPTNNTRAKQPSSPLTR